MRLGNLFSVQSKIMWCTIWYNWHKMLLQIKKMYLKRGEKGLWNSDCLELQCGLEGSPHWDVAGMLACKCLGMLLFPLLEDLCPLLHPSEINKKGSLFSLGKSLFVNSSPPWSVPERVLCQFCSCSICFTLGRMREYFCHCYTMVSIFIPCRVPSACNAVIGWLGRSC